MSPLVSKPPSNPSYLILKPPSNSSYLITQALKCLILRKQQFGRRDNMSYRVEELCEVDHFQEQMTTMLEKTIGKVSPFFSKVKLASMLTSKTKA